MSVRHIYYLCCHFPDLVLSQGLCSFFHKFFPEVEQHLLLVEHPYFSRVNLEEFLEGFDSVCRLPFCEGGFTNRWRSELSTYAIYSKLIMVRAFLKAAKKITIHEESLFLIVGITETALAERLLLRKIRRNSDVFCRIGLWHHMSRECKTNDWVSWLLRNVYVVLGAYPISTHFDEWVIAEQRYYREKKITDYRLVFSNKWERHQDHIEIKYPLADEKQRAAPDRQKVFFFGGGIRHTSIFPDMSRERWIATMNQILQALTDLYKEEDVVLVFKGHPNVKEIPYDLAGFEVYDEDVASEMIFMQRRDEIRAVYSVSSGSARTASLFGIDSYVFDEMFDLPEEIMDRNRRTLLDFSDVVSIRSLDELRLPQPEDHPAPTTKQDLERLAQLFQELTSQQIRARRKHRVWKLL